jgi:hypothetical protein
MWPRTISRGSRRSRTSARCDARWPTVSRASRRSNATRCGCGSSRSSNTPRSPGASRHPRKRRAPGCHAACASSRRSSINQHPTPNGAECDTGSPRERAGHYRRGGPGIRPRRGGQLTGRPWRWGRRSLAVAVAGLTLSVAAVGTATGLPPVGSLITGGDEFLPQEGDHVVVATGESPALGPWQLQAYTSGRLTDPQSGAVYQSTAHPCLGIRLTDPREGIGEGVSAVSFRRLPGSPVASFPPPHVTGARKGCSFSAARRRARGLSGSPGRAVSSGGSSHSKGRGRHQGNAG